MCQGFMECEPVCAPSWKSTQSSSNSAGSGRRRRRESACAPTLAAWHTAFDLGVLWLLLIPSGILAQVVPADIEAWHAKPAFGTQTASTKNQNVHHFISGRTGGRRRLVQADGSSITVSNEVNATNLDLGNSSQGRCAQKVGR